MPDKLCYNCGQPRQAHPSRFCPFFVPILLDEEDEEEEDEEGEEDYAEDEWGDEEEDDE